jgi:DNA-binding transcriptional MerR regulator
MATHRACRWWNSRRPWPGASGSSRPENTRISEARDGLGLTSRAIRHYEELGLITCTRDARGIRMLGKIAMQNLRLIRDLREAGVSIPQIAGVLDRTDDREAAVRQLFIDRLDQLERERERVAAISAARGYR